MTKEDIIRMAREAGFEELFKDSHDWVCFTEEIERFAALVAAHVRETEFKPDWNKYQQGLADGAAAERENYDNLFSEIKAWSEAYPVSTFPEPDFKKAHKVLSANGMTLDAISASNMRHVITQVQNMIDAAIRARGQA